MKETVKIIVISIMIFVAALSLWLLLFMYLSDEPEVVVVMEPEIEVAEHITLPVDIEPTPEARPIVITKYKDAESEKWLWNCLNSYTGSEVLTAGIMGYFWRESSFQSDSVAGWINALAYSGVNHCEEFTKEVDEGLQNGSTFDIFFNKTRYQYGGYGLGQWSGDHYLIDYYDFAREWGTTIADAEMQCAFTVQSIQKDKHLWPKIKSNTNPKEVGYFISVLYDGSYDGAEYISYMAQVFYNRYATEEDNQIDNGTAAVL